MLRPGRGPEPGLVPGPGQLLRPGQAGPRARESSWQDIAAHFWTTIGAALKARPAGLGHAKAVWATKKSDVEFKGPGRTTRKVSRRHGRMWEHGAQHASRHASVYCDRILRAAPGEALWHFGRPRMVWPMKARRTEPLRPGRIARKVSRRPGRTPSWCPTRVIVHFGALLGDTQSGSTSTSCGIWTSKSG